jgi:hypothetical protein
MLGMMRKNINSYACKCTAVTKSSTSKMIVIQA